MEKTKKKGFFNNPLFRTTIRSSNVGLLETIVGYLCGPVGGLLANGIFTAYLNDYYTSVLFVDLLADTATRALINGFLTIMPLVSAVLIVVCNIFIGQLIERTKTSAGKARPWILVSSIALFLACALMFGAPLLMGGTITPVPAMILTAVSYNLYYSIAYPLYNTANSTLVPLSTRNSKQRGLLATASNTAVTAAAGAGSMIFPILLGIFVKESDLPADKRSAYFIMFLIIGIISFLLTVVQFYFTRERVTEEQMTVVKEDEETAVKPKTLKEQFNAIKSDKFWWIIILFVFFFQMAGQIKNTSLVYYAGGLDNDAFWGNALEGITSREKTVTMLGLCGTIPFAAAMVITWPLSNKISKRWTVIAGLVIGIIGDLICVFSGVNVIGVAVGVVFKNLGCAPACYTLLAMISDMLDHGESKNRFRCDGLTMSIYSAIFCASAPIAVGLVNLFTQSGTSFAGAEFSYVWLEAISFAICSVILFFFTVEKGLKEDQALIRQHQKEDCEAAGQEWIEPEERMRLQDEENDRLAEEDRINELKAKCEKKGLNFEEEEAKYQAKKAKKKK